jgi:predicted metalloprotease with PDZ domain
VYDEKPSEMDRIGSRDGDRDGKTINAHYSVGLLVASDGVIRDTVEGMLAAKAGIGPGMKIIAVNGRAFSADAWHDAIRAAKASPSPIELIVENTDYFRVVKLDYHGGEKYPHLVRDESKPDLLTEIYRAK